LKAEEKEGAPDIVFTEDNAENIRRVMGSYKNILVCGVKGVGKITNTVNAVRGNTNICYLGNPLDYEGKRRPGSYEKYLHYIRSLKGDLKIIDDINKLLRARDPIVLIIDEIYGRSHSQLEQIGKLCDKENIRIFQIVGCLKYMGALIEKMDIIIELHLDGAFIIDKELGRAICRIFGQQETPQKLPFS
jgi:hypothetical protein